MRVVATAGLRHNDGDVMPTPTPIALAEARAKGEKHYFTGVPCKNGHLSLRSTNKQRCLACMREWQQKRRVTNPQEFRDMDLKRHYGITRAQHTKMLEEQGHACAICDASFTDTKPHVDHDHATGAVRGLLCSPCNLMLGHARDNTEVLARAITYLKSG